MLRCNQNRYLSGDMTQIYGDLLKRQDRIVPIAAPMNVAAIANAG